MIDKETVLSRVAELNDAKIQTGNHLDALRRELADTERLYARIEGGLREMTNLLKVLEESEADPEKPPKPPKEPKE